LFRIGKICAESGWFLEEGLLCLDDYLNIINFQNPTNLEPENKQFELMKAKALFYVGIIFFKIKDQESCEKYLSLVRNDLYDLGEK